MVFTSGSVCSAINCTNNKKKTPHLSFFRFPKDPARSRKWAVNCGREDLVLKDADYLYKNVKFCSLHFEPNQFMNVLRNKLVWNAVPTIFEIPNKQPQVLLKRRRLQTRRNTSKAKKLLCATAATNPRKTSDSSTQSCLEYKMFETVECNTQPPEDDTGSDMIREPQMFGTVECKVEPHEDDTGSGTVTEPQMFEAVKVEPLEDNTEPDVVHEPPLFGAVECKVEAAEDNTRSDVAREPQDFVFVTVKMEPSKGTTKETDRGVPELQASAAAAKGDGGTRTGDEAAPHPPSVQPRVAGRKQKTTIHGQARKIILNVAQCCDLEKQKKQLLFPLNDPLLRAAAYTGRSVESLMEMRQSSEVGGGGNSVTSPPNKKRKTNGSKMADFDDRVVRETIEEFYTVRKAVPTLGKLASALREKTGCEWESTAALRKTLKSMGFVWRKVDEEDGRTFLLERFSLVRWRSRFIVGMKYRREVGREIFYLDESWIDTNLKCGKYQDGGGASGCPQSAGTAPRLVVWSVGSRKGYVEEATLSFRATSTKKRPSAADFEKWFETSVLPNLPPESVIVMDDAPHHCRQVDPAPTAYDPKVHMVAWLRRRGVECDNTMMKYVLWQLVQANGGSRKEYVVDQTASLRGHSVMRLPPNVRDLSAADMVGAKIVKYVREHATPGLSFANLQKISAAAFRSITVEDWEEYCGRVRCAEEEYWRRDGVVEDAVDDVITNPGRPDSSDDSEDSVTEDSETESD